MTIDVDIPKGWRFDLYHLRDDTWTVSLTKAQYAKFSIVLKGKGTTIEAAMKELKAELSRRACEV